MDYRFKVTSDKDLEDLKSVFSRNGYPKKLDLTVDFEQLSKLSESTFFEEVLKNSDTKVMCMCDLGVTKVINSQQCKVLDKVDQELRSKFNNQLYLWDNFEFDSFGFRETLNANRKIDDIANRVKSATVEINGKVNPLSTFEKFLMLYNYVTDYVYSYEDKTKDDPMISRHWIHVLEGDKIVCVGYTSLLNELCSRVFSPEELKCSAMSVKVLESNNIGFHSVNYISLKDKKYNIDGTFYVDATWDSRRENQNHGLYSYCCIPFSDVEKLSHCVIQRNRIDDISYRNDLLEFNEFLKNYSYDESKVLMEELFRESCDDPIPKFIKKNVSDLNLSCYDSDAQKKIEKDLFLKKMDFAKELIEKYKDVHIPNTIENSEELMLIEILSGGFDDFYERVKNFFEKHSKNSTFNNSESFSELDSASILEKFKRYSKEEAKEYIEVEKEENMDKILDYMDKQFKSPIPGKVFLQAHKVLEILSGKNEKEAEKNALAKVLGSVKITKRDFDYKECSNGFAKLAVDLDKELEKKSQNTCSR